MVMFDQIPNMAHKKRPLKAETTAKKIFFVF